MVCFSVDQSGGEGKEKMAGGDWGFASFRENRTIRQNFKF
jgi:hypothetical protein